MENPYAKYLEGKDIASTVEVSDNPYAKYLSSEESQKFKTTDTGSTKFKSWFW